MVRNFIDQQIIKNLVNLSVLGLGCLMPLLTLIFQLYRGGKFRCWVVVGGGSSNQIISLS